MNFLLFIALFGTFAQAWRWPWQKPDTPEWSTLSVTWGKFNTLPKDKDTAIEKGWSLTRSCNGVDFYYSDASFLSALARSTNALSRKTVDMFGLADPSNYFAGNRYVLKGDTAVMLLFDSQGKIAGIQNGIPKSAVGVLTAPWISEGDNYVITAYFTDPRNICGGSRPSSAYLGDRLLLQTGNQISSTMAIPFKQEDLRGTKWVRGGCFPTMGRHYWYNISPDMDCKDFFPMFLLYNRDRLTGFGWVAIGNADSPRYEHPPPKRLGFGFFLKETKPKCIANLKSLTTQHVYLDKWPQLNFCFI